MATAIGPSAITVSLNPKMRQLFPEQERLFPAPVADDPAATVTPVMAEEKLKDHWNPVIWAPPVDVRLTGTETVPPAVAVPDPMDNSMLCANAIGCETSRVRVIKSMRTEYCQSLGKDRR